ncbi:MAG TPA: hypothetical protein VGR45_17310 [Stellaceae bacterium]|nr:hypothetical protein [Stellaceae bacterium]
MVLAPISPSGVSTAYIYPTQTTAGQGIAGQIAANPGNTNAPIIFEPPPELSGNQLDVLIVASGEGADWGGCQVWASVDPGGTGNYAQIGTVFRGQVQGLLTANFPSGSDPDTVNTLSVDLTESQSQLIAGTTADADAFVTLCYCDGELIAYSAATLTSAFKYNLGTYIRRGVYGTTIAAHLTGAQFARIIASTFRQSFPSNLVGSTVWFKFRSFNTLGAQLQQFSAVTAYSYTLTGAGMIPGGVGAWFQSFSVGGKFADMVADEWDGNYEIFDVQAPVDLTFPANFSTSPTPGCEVAPGSTATFTFQTISGGTPTTVGTLTIAGSATTGSYSTSGLPVLVPAGDRLRLYAPGAVDAAITGLFGTIMGSR